jgi:hypothetical protein
MSNGNHARIRRCGKGHLVAGDNAMWRYDENTPRCRECERESHAITRQRRRAAQMERGEAVNDGKSGAAEAFVRVPLLAKGDMAIVVGQEEAEGAVEAMEGLLAHLDALLDYEGRRLVRLHLRKLKAALSGEDLPAGAHT